MGLKRRLKPNDHREGQAQRFLDTVQALIQLKNDKKLFLNNEDGGYMDCVYNSEIIEKMLSILNELRSWDITEVGNLYLTSGGRIVLDKGYGEYFTCNDQTIFTKEQLHRGIKLKEFKEKVKNLRGRENKQKRR